MNRRVLSLCLATAVAFSSTPAFASPTEITATATKSETSASSDTSDSSTSTTDEKSTVTSGTVSTPRSKPPVPGNSDKHKGSSLTGSTPIDVFVILGAVGFVGMLAYKFYRGGIDSVRKTLEVAFGSSELFEILNRAR
ncbi:MAG: hypothetical protein Q4A31_09520 [Corynebacterium sp.]|uniref:hypothetical protein n=1 Tax=Corynebacterium sp. TaxID=1720 RepID=UPI0026DAF135|nr:hypothetical protein [Corynebacterium sp.]MDO4762143.1 hypothetical protein [Corynebacterium sp.]